MHLQERWLHGNTHLVVLLKALPVYEAANAAGAPEPVFKDLHELKLAAPERMPAAALEDSFVSGREPGQRAALACLGVEMLSHSMVIRCARAHPRISIFYLGLYHASCLLDSLSHFHPAADAGVAQNCRRFAWLLERFESAIAGSIFWAGSAISLHLPGKRCAHTSCSICLICTHRILGSSACSVSAPSLTPSLAPFFLPRSCMIRGKAALGTHNAHPDMLMVCRAAETFFMHSPFQRLQTFHSACATALTR